MNYDREFASNRLRGLALQIERGELRLADIAGMAEYREHFAAVDAALVAALRSRAAELDIQL